METKINDLLKAWKQFITKDQEGVDENSSWKEIFLNTKLNPAQINALNDEAEEVIGCLSETQLDDICNLPYYCDVLVALESLPASIWGNFHHIDLENGDRAYFLRHQRKNIDVIDVTIVTKKPVDLKFDMVFFYFAEYREYAQIETIRYAREIPSDWLAEAKKWTTQMADANNNGYGH